MHDVGRLATLVTVTQTGSINEAAKRLGYTPPAVSQQLTKLEKEVGAELLVRHYRGVRLTPAGEVLVEYARRILDDVRETREALAQITALTAGRLRIGSFATGGIHLLPSVMASFRNAHPNIELTLEEYEPPVGLAALDEGRVDLVLTHTYEHGASPPIPKKITTEALLVEELILVTADTDVASHGPGTIPWQSVAKRSLISGPRGFANREALENLFYAEGLDPPKVGFETGNYLVACALSSANSGIAFVPDMHVDIAARTMPLSTRRLTSPGLHRTIVMAWRTDNRSPGLHTLRSLLRQTFAKGG